MPIRFTINTAKILEGLVWIASKRPGVGFHCSLKTLFYADKDHLQTYGRPIFGDSYIKMSFGPVGSVAYDLLKRDDFLPSEVFQAVSGALTVRRAGNIPQVRANRPPALDVFSGTDIECLERALARCEEMGFGGRCDATHQERAWIEAAMHGEMDYARIIDDDVPHREELIAHLTEAGPCIAL